MLNIHTNKGAQTAQINPLTQWERNSESDVASPSHWILSEGSQVNE